MCGIIGILGQDGSAAERAMEALKRLEYRGYDSAGIATLDGGKLDRRRAAGKLSNLQALLLDDLARVTRLQSDGFPGIIDPDDDCSSPAVCHGEDSLGNVPVTIGIILPRVRPVFRPANHGGLEL